MEGAGGGRRFVGRLEGWRRVWGWMEVAVWVGDGRVGDGWLVVSRGRSKGEERWEGSMEEYRGFQWTCSFLAGSVAGLRCSALDDAVALEGICLVSNCSLQPDLACCHLAYANFGVLLVSIQSGESSLSPSTH